MPTIPTPFALNDGLQLPRIANRVLDDLSTCDQNILLRTAFSISLVQREVDASVLDEPAAVVSEVNDAAFTWEEEEVLGAGNRKGGVCFFGAGGDFGADGADEDLYGERRGR